MENLKWAYLTTSGIGIVDAIYHAYESITVYHATWCDISARFSCGGALASQYSHIAGIPLYALGLFWFPLTLVVGAWWQREASNFDTGTLMLFLMIGNIFTVYLWYVDLVLINVICLVCISLYLINYLLTLITGFSLLKERRIS